jgi:hypothetical protein
MKLLRKMFITLMLAAFMLAAGAALTDFDARDTVMLVLGAAIVLLLVFAYWLWRGQR